MPNDAQQMAAAMRSTFNAVSATYDSHELRFFRDSARHLVDSLKGHLRGNERVLDVATGTGNVSVLLGQALPRGRVVGIDLSPSMLEQARSKARQLGLGNVELMEMDMQELAFPDASFDVVVSAFGIFFAPDIEAQLHRLLAAVRPGGRIVISTFREDYMSPLKEMLMGRLIEKYGVVVPPTSWKLVASADACHDLCIRAGLEDVEVVERDCGYNLSSPDEWWQVVWNGGYRRWVSALEPQQREQFKREHLQEVESLRTRDGIPMPIGVLFTSGTKAR